MLKEPLRAVDTERRGQKGTAGSGVSTLTATRLPPPYLYVDSDVQVAVLVTLECVKVNDFPMQAHVFGSERIAGNLASAPTNIDN